ncbi:MAG: ArsA family ATPase [Armatimonadota bacterium]
MRIILTAGKGGVGKSTVAAATAARCAARGYRTLVMSIDSAHNLGDLFDLPLGHTPTPISTSLHGLEVNINRELSDNWSAVIDFFRTMTANNPEVSALVAEECAVLPGMEEVFGLMRLQSVAEEGRFDVVVLDAPPTGDLLKFLRLPDVLRWFMEKYHPLERGMLQRMRPVADALGWPVPTGEAMAEMEYWYARVGQASRTLMDTAHASVRLVTTADRVSLAETRRAVSWTSLLGMNLDAVVVNKLLPPADYPSPLAPWYERQAALLQSAREEFAGLPLLTGGLHAEELIGIEALERFGAELYGERDAAGLWCEAPPIQWDETESRATLRIRLPFVRKGELRVLAAEDGLVLHIGTQRRTIPLPGAVVRRQMRSARWDAGWLAVEYGPRGPASPESLE